MLVALAVLALASSESLPLPEFSELATLQFRPAPSLAGEAPPDPDTSGPRPAPGFGKFGEKGSWRWYLSGGYGQDFRDTENGFAMLGGGVSYFVIDDLSLGVELNLLYFRQVGEDPSGINFNLLARWHFLVRDRWSLYVDGGAGILGTTQPVPDRTPESVEGTRFNFTPQAGGGMTYEIRENTRFFVGLRWHHISNARSSGDNPARDSILVYVGVSFPF